MNTSFLDIYSLQEILKDDKRLALKTSNQLYQLYNTYLQYGIGLFYPYCYKDLVNGLQQFSQIEYYFEANGSDNDFQLSTPSIPLENGLFYVGYRSSDDSPYTEVQPSNYAFSQLTNNMTINLDTFIEGTQVYISSYLIGSFSVSLDFMEQNILANAMLIPYLKEANYRSSLLNQMVYGGSTKIYSQSQHLDSVHKTAQDQIDEVTTMIMRYTYRLSPNKLKDLGMNT